MSEQLLWYIYPTFIPSTFVVSPVIPLRSWIHMGPPYTYAHPVTTMPSRGPDPTTLKKG